MDRCAEAFRYRNERYNCAQAVALAFADLLGREPSDVEAAMSGFGGGVGGCHEEVCGALSGGVYVLGALYADPEDRGGHGSAYPRVQEFRRRFQAVFGLTRCGDLREAGIAVTERTPAAARLGVTAPCDCLVVTAAEILEDLLAEAPPGPDGGL